jgi:hypothetical protein
MFKFSATVFYSQYTNQPFDFALPEEEGPAEEEEGPVEEEEKGPVEGEEPVIEFFIVVNTL